MKPICPNCYEEMTNIGIKMYSCFACNLEFGTPHNVAIEGRERILPNRVFDHIIKVIQEHSDNIAEHLRQHEINNDGLRVEFPGMPNFDDPLIGCNGEPHSNDFLKQKLTQLISEENYLEAKVIHDELNKRGMDFNPI